MIIYKVTNTLNGKVYVGQTVKTLKERWAKHLSDKSGCLGIKSALKKYGPENFTIEQIDQAESLEELNKKESEWIAIIGSLSPFGYNLTTGGDHYRLSQESRDKMSKSLTGRKLSKSHIEKMSERMRNRIVSQETREKTSKRCKGKTTWAKGKKFTADHRAKISAASVGKVVSEETKQKLSDHFKGHKQSQETLEKRRQTCIHKNFFMNPPKPIKCIQTGIIYPSTSNAAKQMNLSVSLISKVLRKLRTHTGGFTFEYVEKSQNV